ncbi:hypothetical protein [Sporosarcina limicola]|uniref:Uncharacterized protein n=1 Tax=Sporosarcina limicola TaxID=34101 RepID=A0A927MLI1_9BACL|nr:hypothetical protein [Sporosarcina limicola]MBE1556925.1 hypothetical protein [Sporosarcina limicola]
MGYILPIQPIQSQQYANRMAMESYDFAYIDRVGKVQLSSDFSDALSESFHQKGGKNEEVEPVVVSPLSSYKGFIYPNPVNLSPAIALVVGKGLAVNAYI